MERTKIIGALLLFVGAFMATRQLLAKSTDYIILGCGVILALAGAIMAMQKGAAQK